MMNRVKLCKNSYIDTHYQSDNDTIYLNLRLARNKAINEDMFMKILCFDISHEYLHHLLFKQFGHKKCRQLDNMFKKAQKFTYNDVSFNAYLIEHHFGGF